MKMSAKDVGKREPSKMRRPHTPFYPLPRRPKNPVSESGQRPRKTLPLVGFPFFESDISAFFRLRLVILGHLINPRLADIGIRSAPALEPFAQVRMRMIAALFDARKLFVARRLAFSRQNLGWGLR